MADGVTALVGVGSAIFGGFVSGDITWLALGKRIKADENLAEKKFEFDKDLAQRKFEFDSELTQRKFDFDRSQLIHKRRFELAEALLADAYRFRDLMAFVRNGAAFGNEGETRKSDNYESEKLKRARDMYFVPIERLQKESEFVSAFFAKQQTARAHFGADAEKAFQFFGRSLHDVQYAARKLIDSAGDERDHDSIELFKKTIWSLLAKYSGSDEIEFQITEALELIEGSCRPALEWQGG